MSTTIELGPDELRRHIRDAEQKIARLEAAPDPGAGKPSKEAGDLRRLHLQDLESATDQLAALRREWEATSPEEAERRSLAERFRWHGRKRAAAALHSPEANQQIRVSIQALQDKERERSARRKLAKRAERRANPPDPRAESILAAVAADAFLLDCLEDKFRPIEGQEGMTATAVLDAHDIGVLLVTLTLLTERNPIVFQGWATSARWPTREPRLAPVDHLRESLRELSRLQFLDIEVSGDTASVRYGARVQQIAEKWGIDLTTSALA